MEFRLLEGLSDADRRAVLATGTRRRYRRDDTVFHEDDPGDTLHLIAKGHIAVRVSTPMGEVATLAVMGPGESFGELALVGPQPRRSASVVALDEVETLALHRRDFDDLCQRHPHVRQLLVEVLANQVRRLSGQILEALYVPADTRVIRRLQSLVGLYAAPGATRVTVPVTQDALATMAGTTRPTANRALQDLAAAGVIELARGRIEVVDLAMLARKAR